MKLIIHTDGGSRGNPGMAASAFVVQDETEAIVYEYQEYLGITTNNVAEYTALLAACQWLSRFSATTPVEKCDFFLDSLLVVQQVSNKWKVKEAHLSVFVEQIRKILSSLSFPTQLLAIPREKNTHADKLVNQKLDTHKQSY
jgi:ribonuclease HI